MSPLVGGVVGVPILLGVLPLVAVVGSCDSLLILLGVLPLVPDEGVSEGAVVGLFEGAKVGSLELVGAGDGLGVVLV